MSDILIMTLGLLAGVVGCLAKPCRPEAWTHVKASRTALEALPSESLGYEVEADLDLEPESEHGFADGLAPATT